MTKYTPGPWTIAFRNCGGGSTISAPSADHIVHTTEVAKVNNSKGRHVTSAEADANAVLVAASPKLYEAAKMCFETWNHKDYSENSFQACMDLLEEAIATAEAATL
ncbi:MAG: hypothetical protein CL942_14160 [Desulfovibrio sp.]|nr:hypothetical protein [Desulfovibrio sp.]|tara:strand:- start:553 stop:870 length:318 start_codon:yes stop_codon:yes gene_type:complete